MSDIYLMDAGFQPPRQGRRPLVDINDLLVEAENNKGSWVAKNYDERLAASAVRQLRTLSKKGDTLLEYGSRKEEDGSFTVFCRRS